MKIFELGASNLDYGGDNSEHTTSKFAFGTGALGAVEGPDPCTAADQGEDWFVNSGERVYQHLVAAQKGLDQDLTKLKKYEPNADTSKQIMEVQLDMLDTHYDFNAVEGVNKFNIERCGYDYYNTDIVSHKMYPLGKGKRYKVIEVSGTNIPATAGESALHLDGTINDKKRAYDGDLFSTVFTTSDTKLIFDLGTSQGDIKINQVDIAWFMHTSTITTHYGNYIGNFGITIQESDDGTNWTTKNHVYDNSRDNVIYRGQRTWWHYKLTSPITKRYIRVYNTSGFGICEFSFLNTDSLTEVYTKGQENLASNGIASQSSTHEVFPNLTADKAIDKILKTPNVAATANGTGNNTAWWQVDLKAEYNINNIKIYPLGTGEATLDYALSDASVYVSSEPFPSDVTAIASMPGVKSIPSRWLMKLY